MWVELLTSRPYNDLTVKIKFEQELLRKPLIRTQSQSATIKRVTHTQHNTLATQTQ